MGGKEKNEGEAFNFSTSEICVKKKEASWQPKFKPKRNFLTNKTK